MAAPIKSRPVVINCDENILPHMNNVSTPLPEGMTCISLICNKGSAHSILFTANVMEWAGSFAGVIGRIIHGSSLPCRLFRLVKGDFRCMNRCNGKIQMTNRSPGA